MNTDNIIEIGINEQEQLYIKPQKKQFTLIWTTATGVQWDQEKSYLFSTKPREWSYIDWYKHIIAVISDCGYNLLISKDTVWVNISNQLKVQIMEFALILISTTEK